MRRREATPRDATSTQRKRSASPASIAIEVAGFQSGSPTVPRSTVSSDDLPLTAHMWT